MSREQIITQLMEEHYDKIYQCLMNDARRLGAGPLLTETEDCIQEALLLLYDQWPKYETTENLPGWLYITALNTLKNRRRLYRAREKTVTASLDQDGAGQQAAQRLERMEHAQAARREWAQEGLQRIRQCLTQEEYDFLLAYFQGEGAVQAMARALNVSEASLWKKKQRLIGNPLNGGRRRYEWQAGRQLKKVYVKADLKEGTKPGVDEQSGTVLKIVWSNGNLLDGEVASTQASAIVTRCGVDVTEEYAASAFAWKRDSGNAGADETWNAAHAGMKTISLTMADLNGDVKITCTLTGNGPSYGSIAVDEDMDATHMRGTLDANDTFQIVNGELKVTTSRGNVYALEDGKVKGAGAKLNGSLTAETKLFASQPEDMVEFSYDHNGLRTQKKVTKTDGTVETTDYTLHGKLVTHLTRGSDEMHFFYDNEKHPVMVDFNGTRYSYVHNLQGDIVAILDAGGSLVVEYKYDAWGKPTLVRTLTTEFETLAELNPFRYRGYVWDGETGLYYLRNRYYCPLKARFLNGDKFIIRKGMVEKNSFVYCSNQPIRFSDPEGAALIEAVITDWPSRVCNSLLNTPEKIADALDLGNALLSLVAYHYAASGEKTLSLPIFLYDGQMPKEISVSNFSEEKHTCGLLKKIVQDGIKYGVEFLGTDGVGDIINAMCSLYGLPQVGEWIENGATIITNFELLEGFLDAEPHAYYTYSAMVEYTYEGGEMIRAYYSFDRSDNSACDHYDGIFANVNVHGLYGGFTYDQFFFEF